MGYEALLARQVCDYHTIREAVGGLPEEERIARRVITITAVVGGLVFLVLCGTIGYLVYKLI
jgi:hypothetical protein